MLGNDGPNGSDVVSLRSIAEILMRPYPLVYDMAEKTKTIRVSEDLHARIRALSREGESLSETLERLLRGPSLLVLEGMLSDEEAEVFRRAIEDSYRATAEEP